MKVKSKVWIEKNGELVFGAGRAMILRYILKTGSINKAAQELNMSYRHAWSYLKSAEKRLNRPLIICTRGGANGGSTSLTPYAKKLLKRFVNLERRVKLCADKVYQKIF